MLTRGLDDVFPPFCAANDETAVVGLYKYVSWSSLLDVIYHLPNRPPL
jgi:hypothetical protein